ncbi:GGDEF domain-containing protein [Pseudomonas gingeri]|uniref:diguanylate cyclase n=1 Tax=Pseudomonas gingeri TaxID=117681 RepID=A0A7Y8CK63_9PSED|nr:GGDEF domain-containing protein [Pseudomonas gingeri]NWB30448.1 diguanylate cyclase [Pseudomonas gingeri]NWC33817.1 diguanylate cyclase [Pseudomonas gingeri]NWD04464.1 diguanylate cyclase [Pseudomonas gingeri]NWE35187.1 diguanylate cyclase [Pseudomonas gingeri]NWE55893.1 diguanylate cyclase [Pseudomonas gingeri]
MSSEEAQRWKEKYLKSIEQQEKLERRWDARLDLLRRGLVRSTLAAEGTDRAVDQCMKEMREVVRTDDMDGPLAALLPRLEKAVLDSEQRRETRVEQISSALTALVTQLQSLPLPREVSRPLKNFAKQLDGRVGQAREIPLLLSELSGLQGKALTQLEQPAGPERPGLLQRLFGSKETVEPATGVAPLQAQEVAATATAAPVASPLSVEPAAALDRTPPAPEPVIPAVAAPVAVAPVTEPPAPAVAAIEPEAEPETVLPTAPAEVVAYTPPVVLSEAAVAPASVPASVVSDVAVAPVVEAVPAALTEPAPASVASPDQPEAVTHVPPPALAFLDSLPLPLVMAEALAAVDPEDPEPDVLYALPESPEPSYSSVAEHIESTLLGLLDDLTLPERHRPHAEAMRHRLEHGLNWYELLPILDDLAVLMLAINDSGQHEFEVYLQQLNERLESFQTHLQAASEGHAEGRSAANDLHSQLREHVGGLQSSVQDAADLDSLKHVLENRLEGLLGTMDQHQQQRDLREQEVAGRLQSLAERVAHMEQEAQGYRDHLEEQRQKALIDPLTGLPNRAAWSERLDHEVAQWQQHGNTLLIAMLDLDHFKRINDNYGHLAGDKVLKIIASVLRKRLRPSDFIARFGGEEFVLLVPGTPVAAGLKLAESLRAAIEACPFHFKGERVTITVSIGVSAFKAGERSDHVLKRADEALYRAKDAGRNRVETG